MFRILSAVVVLKFILTLDLVTQSLRDWSNVLAQIMIFILAMNCLHFSEYSEIMVRVKV